MKARLSSTSSSKARAASVFPASIIGENGVTVDQSGRVTTIGFDLASSELGAELDQAVSAATDQATASEASATSAASSKVASAESAIAAQDAATAAVASASADGSGALVGRLTAISGMPVTVDDCAAVTTLYLTPSKFPVSDGTNVIFTDSPELSFPLDSASGHTGYHAANKNYDVFKFDDGGTIRIGTGPDWSQGGGSNAAGGARGAGVGSTELEFLGNTGFFVNKNDILLRWGTASGNTTSITAGKAVCVGGFRCAADGQTEDSQAKRFIFNMFNRDERKLLRKYPETSTTYSLGAWRQANANTLNKVEVFCGVASIQCLADVFDCAKNSGTDYVVVFSGLGVDSTTVNSADLVLPAFINSSAVVAVISKYRGSPGIGYHALNGLQYGGATADVQTWFGVSDPVQSGLLGSVWL